MRTKEDEGRVVDFTAFCGRPLWMTPNEIASVNTRCCRDILYPLQVLAGSRQTDVRFRRSDEPGIERWQRLSGKFHDPSYQSVVWEDINYKIRDWFRARILHIRQPRFNSYRRILMAVRFVVAVTRRSRSTKLLYFEPA